MLLRRPLLLACCVLAVAQSPADELTRAYAVDTFMAGGAAHAVVTSHKGDGFQILDLQDPGNPKGAGSARDNTDGFSQLAGASDVKTFTAGGEPYAIITAATDNGFQIVDLKAPNKPVAVGSGTDGEQGYDTLAGAVGVATFRHASELYAIIAASTDNGFTIISLANLSAPVAVGSGTDGRNGYEALRGAIAAAAFTVGGAPFAIVVSPHDHGFQIVNLREPSSPTAAASGTDGERGFNTLAGASAVSVFLSGGTPYAIVTAPLDNGFQVINLSNPFKPTAAGSATDGSSAFHDLKKAYAVDTFALPGDTTYAIVAAFSTNGFQMISLGDPYSPAAVDVWDDGKVSVQLQGVIAERTFVVTTSEPDAPQYCCDLRIPLCAHTDTMYCLLAGRAPTMMPPAQLPAFVVGVESAQE